MFDFHKRKDDIEFSSIPVKANKLLYILLSITLLLALRIWHLSVIQHEKKVEEAFRPRKKVVTQVPERGTIRDRFNLVLAANKMEYRVSVVYSELREIPTIAYEKDAQGLKIRRQLRKEYIRQLAKLLANELDLDFERVEDLIHSHASQYDTIPFVVKTNISEKAYYRLKFLEKDFPGLLVERIPQRYYPYGSVASHVIGYVGPIQKEKHQKQVQEIRALSEYVKQQEDGIDCEHPVGVDSVGDAKRRLIYLQEKAYSLNDNVGIQGVEAEFEDDLRGFLGKKIFFSDAKGNFVRTMPGARPPLHGKRLLLSLSIELQDFAERLLALSEIEREKSSLQRRKQKKECLKEPWMRGGAIVAIDPNSGEVLTLASYPRFDPNDFTAQKDQEKNKNRRLSWIENEDFQERVWDQRQPLVREVAKASDLSLYDEESFLSWRLFLEFLLPDSSPLINFLAGEVTVKDAVLAQRAFDQILKLTPNVAPSEVMSYIYADQNEGFKERKLFEKDILPFKKVLDRFFTLANDNQEKLLLLDLSRLVLFQEDFSDELLDELGSLSLSSFRTLSCGYAECIDLLKNDAKKIFHELDFKEFRKLHEKEYLKEKRRQEKELKKPHKPYLDYLDKWEKAHFKAFWQKKRQDFLEFFLTARFSKNSEEAVHDLAYLTQFAKIEMPDESKIVDLKKMLLSLDPGLVKPALKALKSFQDLDVPLYGRYSLKSKEAHVSGKELAKSFMKSYGGGALRSYAFRQSTIQGSIFKLVTAYSGLKQRYNELSGKKQITSKDLNLFEITDQTYKHDGKTYVGYFADGKPIPQLYKGGRIPKSMRPNNGHLDLVRAIEFTSNPYFSLLAAEFLKDPLDLVNAAKDFGYGEKSGIELPGELKGNVPSDLKENRTGLYATAIGQHTLITTPLQTALMLSAIANGGSLLEPKIARLMIGKNAPFETRNFRPKDSFYLQKSLQAVGFDFPLFPEGNFDQQNEVHKFLRCERRKIFLPDAIRSTLLEGMRRSAKRSQDEAQNKLLLSANGKKSGYKELVDLKTGFVGKTSTAEVIERVGLEGINPSHMYRHIWFGAAAFDPTADENPHTFVFRDQYGKPELVVVVYLRFAGYGKDAAPLAAQVVKKWREIQHKH